MRIQFACLAILSLAFGGCGNGSLGSNVAAAQDITMGVTSVLSDTDGGNGNLLLAQSATLSQNATIQSISLYVVQAGGNLVLGVYDASGPGSGPGKLVASTAQFTPTTGWNTENVVSQVALTAGTYWLAYNPSSNNLEFPVERSTGNCVYYSHTSGTSLPSAFSTSPSGCTPTNWSIYATLATGAPANTAPPVISGTTVAGDTLTTTTGTWTNNPTSYSYQWYWADVSQPILGATSSSYTLQSGDVGHTIEVQVTATNSSGNGSAYSAAVGPVTASGGGGQMITMGVTSVLGGTDGGNGNLLLAQSATLSQNATIQSISFYVVQAGGKLILGVYDASGPGSGPGKLVASTAQFTPTTGWNTENVVSQVALTAGTYWLAYNPSSNNLEFPVERISGTSDWYSYTENGSLPSTFSTGPSSAIGNWSIYATLQAGGVSGAPVNTAPPVISGTTVVGDTLTTTTGTWTNNPTSYSYQWNANGTAISGATSSSYVLVSGEVGDTITVTVTATNSYGSTPATSNSVGPVTSGGGSSGVPFTPLHLYYVSPTGSDSNSGTSPSDPWLTPNHPVDCGDVIIAAPGSYSPMWSFGSVSNCPSSSGGIDGNGGVYFATLLCGGNVGTCQVTEPSCNVQYTIPGIEINQDNWAVEGWGVSMGYNGYCAGMAFEGDIGGTANGGVSGVLHHIAYINNIAYNNGNGFGMDSHGATNPGADYWAIVGNIAQNSGGRSDCHSEGCYFDAAIDVIGVQNYDTSPGTHIFLDGNIAYNSQQTADPSGCTYCSDGENYMFDTLDVDDYTQQIVARNNLGVLSEEENMQMFYQGYSVDALTLKVYNNTMYAGAAQNYENYTEYGAADEGEFNIATDSSTPLPWNINLYNNIGRDAWPAGQAGGKQEAWALVVGANYGSGTTTAIGNTGGNPANSQNIFKGLQTACPGGDSCDPGYNVISGGGSYGVNTYEDPMFNNSSDALANRMGVPNCSGFTNTVACMGYNANTGAFTNPSLLYDMMPTASGTLGKGMQLPSTTCVSSDPDYPSWLKGIVYLYWNSSTQTITENSDLVTKPCGL